MEIENQIKINLAYQFFNNSDLCSSNLKKNALLTTIITEKLANKYFKDKNVTSSESKKSIQNLQDMNNHTKQFKQVLSISYDDIKITLKGIFIEDSSKLSINIHFNNKLTNQEELVHFEHDFKSLEHNKPLTLDENIEKLTTLLKKEFFDKFFEIKEVKKPDTTSNLRVNSNRQPPRTRIRSPDDFGRNPRPLNPPGIFPGRSPYPGLNPYIRYGKT
jgi:hypothetical protein